MCVCEDSLNIILEHIRIMYPDVVLNEEDCHIRVRVPESKNQKVPSYVVIVTVINKRFLKMEADYYRLPNLPKDAKAADVDEFYRNTFDKPGLRIIKDRNIVIAESEFLLPLKIVNDTTSVIDDKRHAELRHNIAQSFKRIIDLFREHYDKVRKAKELGFSFNQEDKEDKE